MHTLRLSLVGAVILMLLAGPGAGVVAGDEEAAASDRPHQVSGTSVLAGFVSVTRTVEEGRVMERGKKGRDTIEMDDARLCGTLWHVWDRDTFVGPNGPDGEVLTGTVQLVNDDGSWVGTMRGHVAYEALGRHHYWQLELTGTGVHDGLSALLLVKGPPEMREVEGFVFPGVLPVYPDPVEVPR